METDQVFAFNDGYWSNFCKQKFLETMQISQFTVTFDAHRFSKFPPSKIVPFFAVFVFAFS